MATTQALPNGDAIPVYLSFVSFRSAVQSLRTHGLPEKLDRTAWQSRSGGEQSQIISAFRFLGLIDGSDKTQPSLKQLVDAQENTEQEKAVLSKLLHEKYGKLFNLNLQTATPGQVSEAISSPTGPTGATRDRAVRFFLKAAYHCGIPLSSRLTAGMRSKDISDPSDTEDSAAAQVTPRRRRRRTSTTETLEQNDDEVSGKAVKTVSLLETGGTLTLSGTFNPFELDGAERKLVYDIIDLMKKYEQETQKASA